MLRPAAQARPPPDDPAQGCQRPTRELVSPHPDPSLQAVQLKPYMRVCCLVFFCVCARRAGADTPLNGMADVLAEGLEHGMGFMRKGVARSNHTSPFYAQLLRSMMFVSCYVVARKPEAFHLRTALIRKEERLHGSFFDEAAQEFFNTQTRQAGPDICEYLCFQGIPS